jgi:nucleoside-diphosphate-sugar epimerase
MGVEPIVLDVLGNNPKIPHPFDRLVYCVGFDRISGRSRREVYVEGLRHFLDTLSVPIPRFVYISSTSAYGRADGSWIAEDDSAEPTTDSGRVVVEAERIARDHGAIVLRLAGLYGPGRIIRRAAILAGEAIPGDPEKRINLVHVDDATSAVVAALDHGTPGRIYNVADDRPIPRAELYGITARLFGGPPPRFVPPAEEEADRLIANRRMKEELGVELRYPDATTGLPASLDAERFTPPPPR